LSFEPLAQDVVKETTNPGDEGAAFPSPVA
jgi:hypothetical protein